MTVFVSQKELDDISFSIIFHPPAFFSPHQAEQAQQDLSLSFFNYNETTRNLKVTLSQGPGIGWLWSCRRRVVVLLCCCVKFA